MRNILKKHQSMLLLILLLLPILVYAFIPGFFVSDDGDWMVIRFSAFYEAIRDGHIPVRWLGRLNHGYGYPVANFLYPGFMYMAVPLKVVGFGFAESIKLLFLAGIFLSGVFSFLWLRKLFSEGASVVGALFYVYFPYHLFDFTKRGSIGEIVGLCFAPLVLYLSDKKQYTLAGIVFGLLILAHNTFAFLITPVLLLTVLLREGKKGLLFFPVGLLLAAFFWIPALFETEYTTFATKSVSSWQEYYLTPTNFSLFGASGVLTVLISLLVLRQTRERLGQLFAVIFLLSILFTFPVTHVLWEISPLPKIVQFPWRFLLLSVVSGSFLVSYFLDRLPKSKKLPVTIFVLFVIAVSAAPYLTSYTPIIREEGYFATNEDTTTVKNEYMPQWVKEVPQKRAESKVRVISGKAEVQDVVVSTQKTQFVVTTRSTSTIEIATVYFPGWVIYLNNNKIPFSYTNAQGLLQFTAPVGISTVQVVFEDTLLRTFANILTVCGIVLSLILLIFQYKKSTLRDYNRKRT